MTARMHMRFYGVLALMMVMAGMFAPADAVAQPRMPDKISLALVRPAGLTPDQFAIRLTGTESVTTCMDVGDLTYETRFKDIYLDIHIGPFYTDTKNMPSAPHYKCKTTYQQPSALIVLSRKDLLDNNVKAVRFHAAPFINRYNVTLTEHYIELTKAETLGPLTFSTAPINGLKNPLKFWFYPDGIVVLSAPQVPPKQDVRAEIDRVARENGLVSLKSLYPNFETPLTVDNLHYYVDNNGRVAGMPGIENGILLDNIMVEQTVYRMYGDEKEQTPMPLYARLPGMYQ